MFICLNFLLAAQVDIWGEFSSDKYTKPYCNHVYVKIIVFYLNKW